MWEDIKSLVMEFFSTHRTRKQGFLVGLIVGAAILIFGFFNTIFAIGCGFIGLYIGSKIDNSDDLADRTIAYLDKILPDKFRR